MHAAKPALAMEQATVSMHVSTMLNPVEGRYTSDLSLTTTLSSRNGTSTLKQHPNGLKTRVDQRHIVLQTEGKRTAAVNRNVLIDFSGSSLTNSMIYFSTAGITPAAPLVGEVTIRPPDAFTSFTAMA